MSDFLLILIKAICCSCAAIGFGILFNTPGKVLIVVGIGGFMAGLVKFILIDMLQCGIISGTLAGAGAVGIVCTLIALRNKMPAVIFLIPSVIPLIPGAFAYRTMLGLMKLSNAVDDTYMTVLSETIRYGVLTLFVVMAIAIGIVVPMLIIEKLTLKRDSAE